MAGAAVNHEPNNPQLPVWPSPRWNVIALAMPLVAFFGGCAIESCWPLATGH